MMREGGREGGVLVLTFTENCEVSALVAFFLSESFSLLARLEFIKSKLWPDLLSNNYRKRHASTQLSNAHIVRPNFFSIKIAVESRAMRQNIFIILSVGSARLIFDFLKCI